MINNAIDLGEVVAVLRMADAGQYAADFSTHALMSARWNGFLDDNGEITLAGRNFLAEFSPFYPERVRGA